MMEGADDPLNYGNTPKNTIYLVRGITFCLTRLQTSKFVANSTEEAVNLIK